MFGGGEGGDLGIRVRVTPVIDDRKLNAEGKKVEKIIGSQKVGVKAIGGLSGGGGVGMKGAAVAGAVGGMVASLAQGLMGMAHKIFGMLVESSGSLKGVMKMLNMGFMQILRPIGDMLAMLLRPVAMFFRTVGREIMKRFRARRAELLASGMSKQEAGVQLSGEMLGMYFEVMGEELAKLDWSKILLMIGELLWNGFLTFNPVGMLIKYLMDHGQEILDALSGFGDWLWTTITDGIGDIADAIGEFGNWLWTTITDAIGDMATALGDFGDWLWKETLKALGTASQWIMDMFDGFGDFGSWLWNEAKKVFGVGESKGPVTDVAKAAQGSSNPTVSTWGGLASAGQDVLNMMGMGWLTNLPFMASGGTMTGDGLIYAHAGEAVLGTDQLRSMITDAVSVNNSTTVVIPGSAISDAIDRRIDYYYRNKVANRR